MYFWHTIGQRGENMQLSSLVGKKIVSPAGEQLGYVTGAYLSRDLKSLAALSAVDGDEEEFILPVRAVQACSDAIIATKSRVSAVCGIPAPIGLKAYSEKGEDLGVVGDWLFGDCEPVFILVKDGVRTGYAADTVASEENVVVYLSGERPAAKKRVKRTLKRAETEKEVPMSEDPHSENTSETDSVSEDAAENSTAEEAIDEAESIAAESGVEMEQTPVKTEPTAKYELGGRNLLGKRVVRSVFDAQGGIVALAGDRITPEVLSRARRKGRLLALTVNTLTNVY